MYFCYAMKVTKKVLERLEDILSSLGYLIRYEKGNFKGGFCMLEHQRLVMINKFYTLEGKINVLIEVLNTIEVPVEELSENQLKLYKEINKPIVSSPIA